MSDAFVIETNLEKGYLYTKLTSLWDTSKDVASYAKAVNDVFDSVDYPLWFIVDFSESSWDLEDVIFGSNFAARDGIMFLRHKNMREFISVGAKGIVSLGVKGLSTPVFGNVPTKRVDTLEDALNYIN